MTTTAVPLDRARMAERLAHDIPEGWYVNLGVGLPTQVADFIPYVVVGNQIVVQKGNPRRIAGRDALCGFKVAVPVSTAFEAAAKKVSADCKAGGKPELDLLALNDALAEFEKSDPRAAAVIKFRFFVGMTMPQVADALGISREALVIPLAPGRPGRVRRLPSGKLEIVLDAETPLAEWLEGLPERIRGVGA